MDTVSENTIHLTRIQKLIGKLMLQSKRQVPSFYMESHVDLTDLVKFRKPYCKKNGIRVTTNDFFYCAIAQTVKQYPLMASKLDDSGNNLLTSKEIGVGFAVAAPQGLVVPVIRNAAELSLPQIAQKSGELLNKARSNKLLPDDLYGANVVLSSLGMYGISTFFAITPPSAAAIVSMGRIDDTIVPTDGQLPVRKTMSVALAADRRRVDELYAAKFLNSLIEKVQDPESLTL